jgi:hypothetical protein
LYQEYDQSAANDLRRRNRRWIVGIFVVVGLMVAAAVIGAVAASGSHSNDAAASTPTTRKPTTTTQKQSGRRSSTTPTTGAPHGSATTKPGTPTTLNPLQKLYVQHPGNTLPKTSSPPIAPPPATPAVEQAYVAAFRQECQSIWTHAGPDGLLWDPDDEGSAPHKIGECYDAMDPNDEDMYDDIPDAQQYAHDNVDSAVEDMTLGYRLRSTAGVVFDVP